MHLHRSDNLTALVEALGHVVSGPLASPFTPETILVPARPVGDWLALRLAELHGVWANPRFVTAERFLADLHGTPSEEDPFAPAGLAWSIAAALPALIEDPRLATVKSYLAGDRDGTKRIALSERLGRTFHRYLSHRPSMLLAWERGEEDGGDATAAWEAVLWGALVEKHGKDHRARRDAELVERLRTGAVAALPERVSVFAPDVLPDIVLDVLSALSKHVPVHLFVREGRHALAASLGVRQEQRSSAITARDAVVHDLAPTSGPASPTLVVHSCHSPMRECEVLRDQLLAALDADRTLEARDVLVLCPDLERYAPVIDAVFGVPEKATGHLPYRIVDRPARRMLRVVEAFLVLLELAPSRLAATDVVDLLAREPVRSKFGLEENEIDVVRRWVSETGIRWAEDELHRVEVGQPRFRENTWRFGLDRLVLGYAMGNEGEAMCGRCLPYDDVEGGATDALGGLASFCEELFAVRKDLSAHARVPLAAWRDRLVGALSRLFAASRQTELQHKMIRQALDAIVVRAERAGFLEEVPLSVVREALSRELDEGARGLEHAVGGVTFASFVSARCVPSRIVAMLGMNDGDFPRAPTADGFDLVAQHPRPGDPSRRDEDRQAFLDALLSAGDQVLITFVGQSIANNKPRPPSVVVSELLDTLDDGARETVFLAHPLHAFSARYFDAGDARLFSHATALCEGAKSQLRDPVALARFVDRPLPIPDDVPRTVSIDALARFFEHPVRAFFQTRLGVSLGYDLEPLEDREPLALEALDNWIVATPLLDRARKGEDVGAGLPPDVAASGKLPLGVVGRASYEDLVPLILPITDRVAALLGSERPAPVPIELDVAAHTGPRTSVAGWLKNVGTQAQVLYTFSAHGGKKVIGAWVRHVALQCHGIERDTVLVCKDGATRFTKVDDPHAVLASLVDLYWRGLEAPLLFFADPALAYADHLKSGHDHALQKARESFTGKFGLILCPYVARAFGEIANAEPLEDEFEPFGTHRSEVERTRFPSFVELTQAVLGPLARHSRKEK